MAHLENGSEQEQAVLKLLAIEGVPEKTYTIERLGITVTLHGLFGKEVYSLREECTHRYEKRNKSFEEFDEEEFNAGLLYAASKGKAGEKIWDDSRLLAKFGACSGREVIKRALLAGEQQAMGDAVLELSAFDKGLSEVKN